MFTEDDDELPVIPDEWTRRGVDLLSTEGSNLTGSSHDIEILDTDEISPGPRSVRATTTKSQQLAEQAVNTEARTFEEMVPAPYREFRDVFDQKSSERFPERRPWDHAIELKPGFEPKSCKVYPLSPVEQKELQAFLDEHLKKGYIRPSKSPHSSLSRRRMVSSDLCKTTDT